MDNLNFSQKFENGTPFSLKLANNEKKDLLSYHSNRR